MSPFRGLNVSFRAIHESFAGQHAGARSCIKTYAHVYHTRHVYGSTRAHVLYTRHMYCSIHVTCTPPYYIFCMFWSQAQVLPAGICYMNVLYRFMCSLAQYMDACT
jgi:hypothetical protein